jgi:hypothetical protein
MFGWWAVNCPRPIFAGATNLLFDEPLNTIAIDGFGNVHISFGVDGNLMWGHKRTRLASRSNANLPHNLAGSAVQNPDDIISNVRVVHISLLRVRGESQVSRSLRSGKAPWRINADGALEVAHPIEFENPVVRAITGV